MYLFEIISFLALPLLYSGPYCIIDGCEVVRSDLLKGLPLRPNATCFQEQEKGISLEPLEWQWPIIFGSWCGTSDG